MRKTVTTAKNGTKESLVAGGDDSDKLGVKCSRAGRDNKLLRTELAFPSITTLAGDARAAKVLI